MAFAVKKSISLGNRINNRFRVELSAVFPAHILFSHGAALRKRGEEERENWMAQNYGCGEGGVAVVVPPPPFRPRDQGMHNLLSRCRSLPT